MSPAKVKGTGKRHSESMKKKAVRRYRAGESAQDLAVELEVSDGAIYQWAQKYPKVRANGSSPHHVRTPDGDVLYGRSVVEDLKTENERLRGLLLDAILGELKVGG